MSTITRAALYIRVSTEEQAQHGFSLAEQRHDLEAYARYHHYAIVDVYADEGNTARKALAHRKQLQRLLVDVQAGRIDVILLKCLDRWFRNVADFYKVQAILDKHGVQWICTQEDYNTTTTNGRLMLNLKLSIAQNESDQTSDRIKYVHQGMLRRKEEIGGKPPLAYRLVSKKLEVIEDQRPIVQFIFDSYLAGHAPAKIARDVFDQFGFAITCKRVRTMLRNETYVGRRYGIDDFCPAIIEPDTFQAVQDRLKENKPWPKNRNFLYLFRQKIICPGCGNLLYGHNAHHHNDRGYGYFAIHYWCGKHYITGAPDAEAGGCPYGGAISEKSIEAFLVENLPNLLEEYRIDVEKQRASVRTDPKQRIQAINAKLARLKDLYVDGFIDKVAYITDYDNLQHALSDAMHDQIIVRIIPPAVNKLMLEVDEFREIYAAMDRQHRYDLWQSTIKSIKIDGPRPKRGHAYKNFKIEFY